MAGEHYQHPGGGFNPPEPTTKGGPDYGRFVDAVRKLQDHARAVDAPDEVITEAADLLEKVSLLLSPFDADEWESPSGRRMDLPMRGNILSVPIKAGGRTYLPGQIVYPGFDPDVLWKFRWYSVINQLLIWTVIALVFGTLIERITVSGQPAPREETERQPVGVAP